MRIHVAGVAVLSMFEVGCHGPGSVDGTIRGKPFEVADAISITVIDNNDNSAGVIGISSQPGLCDAIGAEAVSKNAQIMFVKVGVYAPARDVLLAPQDAGDFAVVDPSGDLAGGNIATVEYIETNAKCEILVPGTVGTKGTISIGSIGDDGAYAGSGEVVLETGETIAIDFSGSPCNALPGFILGQHDLTGCQ